MPNYIVFFVVLFLAYGIQNGANATDLYYNMLSANFGGTNGVALSMAQQENSLKSAHAAAVAAAAARATASANSASTAAAAQNQAFINAIISQLTGLVAYRVATGIANAPPGATGTVQSGDTTITYVNNSGALSVTLTSPSGSTTLTVPTGG